MKKLKLLSLLTPLIAAVPVVSCAKGIYLIHSDDSPRSIEAGEIHWNFEESTLFADYEVLYDLEKFTANFNYMIAAEWDEDLIVPVDSELWLPKDGVTNEMKKYIAESKKHIEYYVKAADNIVSFLDEFITDEDKVNDIPLSRLNHFTWYISEHTGHVITLDPTTVSTEEEMSMKDFFDLYRDDETQQISLNYSEIFETGDTPEFDAYLNELGIENAYVIEDINPITYQFLSRMRQDNNDFNNGLRFLRDVLLPSTLELALEKIFLQTPIVEPEE